MILDVNSDLPRPNFGLFKMPEAFAFRTVVRAFVQ